ncbi:unnamed protein product, partial [marine sediment metagenome]
IQPENPPSELIIIGSHIDSNCEFPLMRMFKYGFIVIIAINLFLTAILLIILLIKNILIVIKLETLFLNIEIIFFWAFLILIPSVLIQLFFIISNRPVMGANDNLSGLAVCYEIIKNLSLPENKLKNVEVWICAFGCEEIGSKGSRNFIKKYMEDLKNAKVINVDMLGNKNAPLLVTTSEIFGLAKTNKQMNELILNSDPAVFGVLIEAGTLYPKVPLITAKGVKARRVHQIQDKGKTVEKAGKDTEVAIS